MLNFLRNYFFVVIVFFSLGCKKDKLQGCTDNSALNYDFIAEENDGTCLFSRATFFARYPAFNGIPITSISLTINGYEEGIINAFYPNTPGNCSANGTVSYLFESGESIDWNTIVQLANGSEITSSGTAKPSRFNDCIKINVTQ